MPVRVARPVVSIHAPTGGATVAGSDFPPSEEVSIHAPTGGATCGCKCGEWGENGVSIHAPTGGATRLLARRRAGL